MKKKSFIVVAVLYVFFSVVIISAGLFLTNSLPENLSKKINGFFTERDIPITSTHGNKPNVPVAAPEDVAHVKKIISTDMKGAWIDLSADLKANVSEGIQPFLAEAEENISFYTNFHTDTLFIKPDVQGKYSSLTDANGNKLDLLLEYIARGDQKKWKKCLIADDSLIFNADGKLHFDKINFYLTNYNFDGVVIASDLLIQTKQLFATVRYYSGLIKKYTPNIAIGVSVASDSAAHYADEQTVNILNEKLTDFMLIKADNSLSSAVLPFANVMSWWNSFASKHPDTMLYILHRTDLMKSGTGEWSSHSELADELKHMWQYENIFGSVFYSTVSMTGKNTSFAQRGAALIENGASEQLKITTISFSNDGKTVTIAGASEPERKLLCNHTLAKANGGNFSFNYLLNPGYNSFEFFSCGASQTYSIYNNAVPDAAYRFITSPYIDNGLGQSLMCKVIYDDTEQVGPVTSYNTYNPEYSTLCKGTMDYVDSMAVSEDGYVVYGLRSGNWVYGVNCELINNAYTMPLNNIVISGVNETKSSTDLVMNTDWLVPVTVKTHPQNYTKGYKDYPFNVSTYTASYVDINFPYTASILNSEVIIFDASSPFTSYELFQGEKNSLIMRLHLRKSGQFYGFDISSNEAGQLVISFKKHSDGSLVGKTIMLDPGHGGLAMTGTALRDNSVPERTVTLSIAKKLKVMLEQRGATVILTRAFDTAYDLDERVMIMSERNPDLFISIHCDGSEKETESGTHTFYFRPYSQPLASAIHSAMVYTYRQHIYTPGDTNYNAIDRGIKYYPFYVTRINQCPSVLVETGFMTNFTEGNILANDNCQYWIAQGINDGIVNYFSYNNVNA